MSGIVKSKLIGITGCTNGGKTTLAKKLLAEFPNSYYLSQDEFYHKRDELHYDFLPEVNSYNFDVITAIDLKKFHRELTRLIKLSKYEFIFIDGILLFDDEKLYKMLDKKYFLDLNKEECCRRRQTRQYLLPEQPNYFEMCAWKEYLKYKQKCESSCRNVNYIDGANDPLYILKYVVNDIHSSKSG